jgi:hypothetical protein
MKHDVDVTEMLWSDLNQELLKCNDVDLLVKWRDAMAKTGRLNRALRIQGRMNLVRNRHEIAALKSITAAVQKELN